VVWFPLESSPVQVHELWERTCEPIGDPPGFVLVPQLMASATSAHSASPPDDSNRCCMKALLRTLRS
jgi:hypothetical protein